jgi:colanic acid biosynthesis glycosyl transferase WcaI
MIYPDRVMPMKIYIVSLAFPPEPVVSAQTSSQIARTMAVIGHQVTVLAPWPSRPMGYDYSNYKRKFLQGENYPVGYEIHYCFSFFSAVSNLGSRFLENISFGFSVFFLLLVLPRADVVYGNTWPIFAQSLLLLACKLRGMPLVLSIQDLYPESLLVQKRGIEKKSWSYSWLHWLDTQTVRNCAKLIVISQRFKDVYVTDRQVPEQKIAVIPNWIDESQGVITSRVGYFRKKYNIPAHAFLLVYGGNIGKAAGVEQLIFALKQLLLQEHIYFLLAGAGSSLPNCLDLIQQYQLDQVKIHSPWDATDTFTLLSEADLCLLPTQGNQSLVSVPSKLLSYMLAGRCVLALAAPESEITRILTDSQAGWVVSTDDIDSLSSCIKGITELSAAELERRGKAGRTFAQKYFSKSQNLSRVSEILVSLGSSNEGT